MPGIILWRVAAQCHHGRRIGYFFDSKVISVFVVGLPRWRLLPYVVYCRSPGLVYLLCRSLTKPVAALEVFILIFRMLTYASLAIIFLQFMQRLGRAILVVDGTIGVCRELVLRAPIAGLDEGLVVRCVEPVPLDCCVLRCGEGAIDDERFFISN